MAFGLGLCGVCCGATFTGQINACAGFGDASSVTVKTTGGTVLWTGTADASGVYHPNVSLPSTVTVSVTPSSTRFQSVTNFTRAVTGGVIAAVTLNPASGFHCMSALCALPLPTNLTLNDPSNPAWTTLRFSSGNWFAVNPFTAAFPDATYEFGSNGSLSLGGALQAIHSHTCPPSTDFEYVVGSRTIIVGE